MEPDKQGKLARTKRDACRHYYSRYRGKERSEPLHLIRRSATGKLRAAIRSGKKEKIDFQHLREKAEKESRAMSVAFREWRHRPVGNELQYTGCAQKGNEEENGLRTQSIHVLLRGYTAQRAKGC